MNRLALILITAALSMAAAAPTPNVDTLWEQEGQTLRQLTSLNTGPKRGEVLLRLGEWERGSADRVRQRVEDGKEPQTQGAADIKTHLDAAETALSESVQLSSKDRLPQVLFSLGDLRRFRNDLKGDQKPFARLVTQFPKDPLAVDAAIALGDDAFDAGNLAEAVRRYQFAEAHAPTDGGRAYAKYKLAWCDMNLEDYAQTRQLLLQVIQLTSAQGQKLPLSDEARRDFVLALARDARMPASDAQSAIHALGLPTDRTRHYEESYATIIAGAGRDEEAAKVLASIELGAPPSEAVNIFTEQIDIAIRQRDLPALAAAGRKLALAMSQAKSVPPGEWDNAEHSLRTAAVTIHGEGRARASETMLQAALGLYQDYFRAFDRAPLAYDLHHHAGELLVMIHRPADAERQYTAAVVRDLARIAAHQAPGKWLQSSALGAVNAAQDVLPKNVVQEHKSSMDETDLSRPVPIPTQLSSQERTFVAACDRYLKALPSGTDAVNVSYQRALVLYRHNYLNEADRVLTDIALDHPEATQAADAGELAMDGLQQLGRYEDLSQLALELKERPALRQKLGAELVQVHETALLASAALADQHQHASNAAQQYLDFVRKYPNSPRVDRALYNAAGAFAENGQLDDAIRARDRLIRTVPKSPLVARARERQLDDLVRLGRFTEAARLATKIALETKGASATTRLHDAIALSEAAGDLRGADLLRQKYLKDHPHGPDAMEYALALSSRARGCFVQETTAKKALSLAPNAAWRVVALDRLAEREAQCHDKTHAAAHAGEAVWLASRLKDDRSEALDAAADAALLKLADQRDKYRSLTLAPPYQRTLPKKLAALKAFDAHLAKVVDRGRAGAAICALVESGQAYANLAQDLGNAKAPHGLTADQREMFKEQLSEKSQPLLDHARQTLVQAIARARDSGTSPACLSDARKSLVTLWPERYGRQEEALAHLLPDEKSQDPTAVGILDKAPDAPAAWLTAARSELSTRHPQAAIVLADRIPKKDFLYPQALEVKARALESLGQTDAALALWTRLAHDFPDRPLAHRVLADRALLVRDLEGARGHLLALWSENAKDTDVALDLAVVLHGLGDVAGAEKALRTAMTLKPQRPELALDLGLLLCGDGGKPREGIAALDEFTRDGVPPPDSKGFQAALAACRALAGSHK